MQVDSIFEAFGELFADFFQHSPHLGLTVEITDEEAARGVTRAMPIKRRVPCDKCDGRGTADAAAAVEMCTACAGKGGHQQARGQFFVQHVCERCRGRGRLVRDPCTHCDASGAAVEDGTITIVVPAGSQHEQTITVTGAGSRLPDGTTGDVYVHLLVGGRPDTRFAGFEAAAEPELPPARVHDAKRPLPIVPIATIACVVAILVALAYAAR